MKTKVIDRRFDMQLQQPGSVTPKQAARWSEEQKRVFEQAHPDTWAIIEPLTQYLSGRHTDTDPTE